MKYAYLLTAGILVSLVHAWLVWHHRANRRYSISEHAILDERSHILYLVTHIICEVLVLLYAWSFFVVEQDFVVPFYLFVIFAGLDFIQALLPSRGRTEQAHFVAAYISWVCYLAAGLVALLWLPVSAPYSWIAGLLFVPVVGMFAYMHVNRSKLYPYQLLMVPLFAVSMLLITIGAS